MSPPLTKAIIASRPLLDPHPETVVGSLILSSALFHKCRISDHLYLVFQWGLHVGIFTRAELAKMQSAYTAEGNPRLIREHEGQPARAPDGTIIEIGGQACPGNTEEPVGPWDFGNVKECVGYLDWRAGLERTLKDVLNKGVESGEVNTPLPSLEKLESANAVEVKWRHGKPLGTAARKRLASERDSIREKVEGFLVFVDKEVKSEKGRQMVYETLQNGFRVVMDGEKSPEYMGVLGRIINKILERVQAFLEYLNMKVEAEPARKQRFEEILEIMERALQSKSKRNLVADQGESEDPQKRIKVSASQDDRPELAAKSAGSSALTPTPTPADTSRESGSRESQHIIQADYIHRHQEQEPEQLLLSTPALVSIPAEIRELMDNKDEQRILTQYFAINKPKKTPAKTSAFSGLIPSADFISGGNLKGVQAANQLLIPAASTRSATQSDSKGEQDEEEDFRRPSSNKLTIELAPVEQRYQLASLYSPPTQGRGSTSQTFDTAVTPQPSHVHTHMDAEDEAEAEDDTKVKQEDLSADEASARLRAAIAGFHSPPPSPSPVRALAPKSPSPGPAPYRRLAYLATPASHDDAEGPQLQEAAHDQLWEGEDEEEEEEEDEEEEGRQASRGASESLFLPLEVKSKTPAKSKSSAARHPTMYHDIIKIEDDDEEEEQEDEIQIISSRDWARSVARKRSGTRK